MENLEEQDIITYNLTGLDDDKNSEEITKRAVVERICNKDRVLVKCLDTELIKTIDTEEINFVYSGGSD